MIKVLSHSFKSQLRCRCKDSTRGPGAIAAVNLFSGLATLSKILTHSVSQFRSSPLPIGQLFTQITCRGAIVAVNSFVV